MPTLPKNRSQGGGALDCFSQKIKISRERLPPGRPSLSKTAIGILRPENEGQKEQPTCPVVFRKAGFSSSCFFLKFGTDTAEDMNN